MSFLFCPCGTKKLYLKCCEPIIAGKKSAETAEQVMRARYSSFDKKQLQFLKQSLHPNKRGDYNDVATERWANESKWKGLEVVECEKGGAEDSEGTVEFIATYELEGEERKHRERAEFRKNNGKWFYYDGQIYGASTVKREDPKVGRNDPCHCGSGKKFKKCHGA